MTFTSKNNVINIIIIFVCTIHKTRKIDVFFAHILAKTLLQMYVMYIMENNKQLFDTICRSAGTAAVQYNMTREGDRVLVGLSGGKDSFVLMHVLDHLQKAAPVNFTFEAATFDPGFENFGTEKIREYCIAHNWKHHTVKLNIPALLKEKDFEESPCVLCSRLRRGKLYGLAAELNCNRLALGQHLDDIVISFLMSLCRGQGLSTMAPVVEPKKAGQPTVIRPLALVPESVIAAYAETLDLPGAGNCIYKQQLQSGDRMFFKEMLKDLEKRIPDIRSNVARSLKKVEIDHLL
jgi:tRNA 2-thiocytidine biosynthesis protein TtcA